MAEENTEFRAIPYRQLFPWLELFRAFRIALDPKKLLLGAGGVVAMYAGYLIIGELLWEALQDGAPPAAAKALAADVEAPIEVADIGQWGDQGLRFFETPLRPATIFLEPFISLFSLQGQDSWTHLSRWLVTALSALWVVLVWGFFGGAISRLAAVQVAREEKLGLGETLRFTREKYFSYVAAPLFPLVFVGLFLLLCFAAGAVAWLTELAGIGVVGALIDGVLMFLLLAAGFVMAFILVGLGVGWPLMLPTIAAEGSDSFDALSRSLSYVFQRPWHYLFYALVATVYGAIVMWFVFFFTDKMVHLSAWAASSGAGRSITAEFYDGAPEASGWRRMAGTLQQAPAQEEASVEPPADSTKAVANLLGGFWLYLLFLFMVGFVHSYFWTATSTIYLLLRRDVDATELDEVYLEEEEDEDFGAPLSPSEEMEPEIVAPPAAPDEATPSGEEAGEDDAPRSEEGVGGESSTAEGEPEKEQTS